MTDRSEIESLIYLLEDPDPFVRERVIERFMILGDRAVPLLDEARYDIKSTEQRQTVDNILLNLVFPDIHADFSDLAAQGLIHYSELERALIMLSQFGNPTLRPSVVTRQLDHMAKVIHDDVIYALDRIEQMNILLTYIFNDCGFHGTKDDYNNPEFSYIHYVLNHKIGIPLSLASIVLLIAERLELPFYGVNMPMHFLLQFENESEKLYIDPYQKGSMISMDHIANFLKMNGVEPRDAYYAKASYEDILLRWMRNMQFAYQKEENIDKINKLGSLLELFER